MNLLDAVRSALHDHRNAPLSRATQLRDGTWRLTYCCGRCTHEHHEEVPCLVMAMAAKLGIREEDL